MTTDKAAADKAAAKFVAVAKDGEVIHVHPTQVEQHRRLGWVPVAKK